MATQELLGTAGGSGSVELDPVVFEAPVRPHLFHAEVRRQLAKRQRGTHATRNRAAVSGGGTKPWRQKGTGRARQGSTRAVQWEGSGVAFPPIPHSWRLKMPKKVRQLARRSALNARAENDRVVLADLPTLEAPKTREIRTFLKALELDRKVLLLTDGTNELLHLSARNLPGVKVVPFGEESVYDVLWAHTVIIERSAIDGLGGNGAAEPAVAEESEETSDA